MSQYGVHENKWLMESAVRMASRNGCWRPATRSISFPTRSCAGLKVEDRRVARAGRPLSRDRGSRHAPHVAGNARATRASCKRRGATLVFENLPQDVPGFARLGSPASRACEAAAATLRCVRRSRRSGLETNLALARGAPRSGGRLRASRIHPARSAPTDTTTSSPISPARPSMAGSSSACAGRVRDACSIRMTGRRSAWRPVKQRATARVYLQLAQRPIRDRCALRARERPGRGAALALRRGLSRPASRCWASGSSSSSRAGRCCRARRA